MNARDRLVLDAHQLAARSSELRERGRRGSRETLPRTGVVAPRIRALGLEPPKHGRHREPPGQLRRRQFRPGDRRRHRRVDPGPRRIRCDGRVGAIVPQVIDEDLVLAPGLRELLREPRRLPPHQRLRQRPREPEALGPIGARRDRNDDVQAAAAGMFICASAISAARESAIRYSPTLVFS